MWHTLWQYLLEAFRLVAKHTLRTIDGMELTHWTVLFAALVLFGFLCLRNLGAKSI